MFTDLSLSWSSILRGPGGNIFAIIARCEQLARRAAKPEHEINAFRRAVTSTHSYADAIRDGRDVVRRDHRR
jgi:hypothetical protein